MEYHTGLRNRPLKRIAKAREMGLATIATLTFAGVTGLINIANAQIPSEPTYKLDAGVGCTFPLNIYIEGKQPVSRTFKATNGQPIRYLTAGRGTTNTYENADTGARITLTPSGGSVSRGTVNPDGTVTWVATGFNTISWFPTDKPPGPSTILYIGRVVYTADPNTETNVSTVIDTSTKQIDICAILSPTTP